jgi:pSer/pThr/pTyr-binding forkhead associated (FHA) protein/tetratricopeptide (TPR) repeat protein
MKLIVLKNSLPINEVEVEIPDIDERYEIFVGRADDCHVLIDDPLISRHHFVIKNEGVDWFCEKLSQLGVVLLNGNIVSRTKLSNGDEIKFGVYAILAMDLPGAASTLSAPAPAEVASISHEPLLDDSELLSVEEVQEATQIMDISEDENLSEEVLLESDSESDELSSIDDNFESNEEENVFSEDQSFGDAEPPESVDFGGDESSALSSFVDEDNIGEDDQDEGTRFFKTFVNYQLVLFGDHAPYDRYLIDTDEIFIGRDTKKCQIILDDPEVSSVHAVLRKNGNDISIEDFNSSNGTILHGERINKAQLNTGDDFVIGSISFTLEVRSDLLDAEADRLMPVEADQVIETEEILEEEVGLDDEEINFDSGGSPEKSIIKRILKNPEQRKKVLIGLVVLGGLWVVLDDEKKEIPQETVKKVVETKVGEDKDKDGKMKPQLSPEQLNRINVAYELGVSFFEQNKYFEAMKEFETVMSIDREHKKVETYLEQTKIALKRLEELDTQKRTEAERIEKKKKIDELLVKAREAVKNRSVQVAENLFGQIVELDPENIDITQLKLELESWQKDEEKKALDKAVKIAARKKMVDALAPGKTFYLKKEWYRAILKLEEFMRIKGMDEDLVKEGSEMMSDAKNQLASDLGPLLGKARSLKEGQDYKNAYESYLEILLIEPTNAEALNEVDLIKAQLDFRSMRIYREAIISESLSLFTDAKEKFQEVQQISPTDSEYFRKASDKLKNYME